MGACDFQVKVSGANAKDAFSAAVDDARWEHGHGGYTGTIAEKHEFTLMTVPTGQDPQGYVDALMSDWGEDNPQIPGWNPFHDKWGPAGCIDLGGGEYLFFGSASS